MLGYLTLRTQMLHCCAADDGKAVSGRNGTPRSSIPPVSPKGTQGQDATIRGGPRFGVRVRQKSPKIASEGRVNRAHFTYKIFGFGSHHRGTPVSAGMRCHEKLGMVREAGILYPGGVPLKGWPQQRTLYVSSLLVHLAENKISHK